MKQCTKRPPRPLVPYERSVADGRRFGVEYAPDASEIAEKILSWKRPSLEGPEELPLPGVQIVAERDGCRAELPWGLQPVVQGMAGQWAQTRCSGGWDPAEWTPLEAEPLSARLGYTPNVELGRLIQEQPQGVICTVTEASRLDALAQVIEAYPDKRMAVLVETIGEAKQIRQELPKRLTDAALARLHRPDQAPGLLGGPAVYIGTISDLHHLQNWAESDEAVPERVRSTAQRVELLLLWKAKAAALPQHEVALLSEPHAKMFGFAPWDAQHTPGEQLAITSFFGFHEALVAERGRGPRPVSVGRLKFGEQRLPRAATQTEVLNDGIRRNHSRNQELVRAAKIYAAEDNSTLLVAADVTHATQLGRCLPSWTFLSRKPEYGQAFAASSGHYAEAGDGGNQPKAIVVEEELRHVELGHYDALIHGGIDRLRQQTIASILFPAHTNCGDLFHILDCDDTQHRRLERFRDRRRAQYRALGWSVDGSDPVRDRVAAFIDERWSQE